MRDLVVLERGAQECCLYLSPPRACGSAFIRHLLQRALELPGSRIMLFHRLRQLARLGLDRGYPTFLSEVHLADYRKGLLQELLPLPFRPARPRLREGLLSLLVSRTAYIRRPHPFHGWQKPAIELPGKAVTVCNAPEFQFPLLLRLQVAAEGEASVSCLLFSLLSEWAHQVLETVAELSLAGRLPAQRMFHPAHLLLNWALVSEVYQPHQRESLLRKLLPNAARRCLSRHTDRST